MDEGHDQLELHPAIRGLKTVCRCNNVKYRTIERAIRNGACTLTQIAVCTTATTGHCGGSCTPDVQQMLDELAVQRPLAALANPPTSRGAVAQMGERLNGIQEVVSSILIGSTTQSLLPPIRRAASSFQAV